MRNDFVRRLLIEMERDPSIYLLTGDLGFHAFEPVQEAFPKRFVNAGIAEQNMVGVAAGLALTGKTPIVYSIAPFATMRCLEQIRTDVCYHDANVKIVGVGGGFNYGPQGVTHHAVEDIAIMRALPNMKVICPAYGWEASEATSAMLREHGPVYLRLGKNPGVAYERPDFTFRIGTGYVIKDGNDLTVICTGNMLDLALAAAENVESRLPSRVRVISMPTVQPIDQALIRLAAIETHGIFTIEEHSVTGGLGSAVAEVLAASDVPKKRFRAFGIPGRFLQDVGSRDYLLARAGLDAETIGAEIMRLTSQP